MINIKKIYKDSISSLYKKWWFVLYFIFIIIIATTDLSWTERSLFFVYSLIIFLVIERVVKIKKYNNALRQAGPYSENKFFLYLLIFSVIFIIATRLVLFIRFGEAPLGYDTGYYLSRFLKFDISLSSHRPLFLSIVPLHRLGLPPSAALHVMYVLYQFLIVGGLYIFFRFSNLSNNLKFTAAGIFFFAISATQFYAYWWMFAQQIFALGLMFATLALLFKKPVLAILTGGLGIIIHTPTFAVFGFALTIFFIVWSAADMIKTKKLNKNFFIIMGAALGMFLILVTLYTDAFLSYVNYIVEHRGLTTTFPVWEVPEAKGLFISVPYFKLLSLIIIPFTLIGLLRPSLWGRPLRKNNNSFSFEILLLFLYIIFITLLILISFPFIYQNRFIIIFDLFLIIFATPTFVSFTRYFFKEKFGSVILIMFLLTLFVRSGIIVWEQKPYIYNNELQDIKNVALCTEKNVYIMATLNTYAPWVAGYSRRPSIGPGLGYDLWDLPQWIEFWESEDNNRRLELLNMYDYPLYIFLSSHQDSSLPFYQFIISDSHFTKINSHIWKYNPGI